MSTHNIKKVARRLALLLLLAAPARAQEPVTWRFDRLTQRDGLSNNQVHCIFQDSRGWMWFGTTHGLNRFDGRVFKVFKHEPLDSTSLSANLVREIFEDSRGHLWIGLEHGGLCRYDRDREIFHRQRGRDLAGISVNDVAEDASGLLWLATSNGLVRARVDERGEVIAARVPLSLLSPNLRKILVDKQSRLWLGSDRGLFLYDPSRERLSHLELPDAEHANDEIWALHADEDERTWIGAYHSGLYYVNSWETRVIKSAFAPPVDRSRTIRAIVREPGGRLWLGTRAGLFSFDGTRHEYYDPGHGEEEAGSLNSVLSLHVDAKGDLWVGSRQGVSHFVKERQFTRLYTAGKEALNNGEIYAFLCEGNTLWIGTELGGVNKLDRETGRFTYYTIASAGLQSDCVKSLLREGEELWLATYLGGISVLNTRTGRVTRAYRATGAPGAIADDRVWALFKDREGNIWTGNSRGVEQYDRATDSFVKRGDILYDGQVNWIAQDSDGDLWIGCENELVIYDPARERVKRYFRKTRAMLEYPRRSYHVTTTDGLAHFDKERGFYHLYTERDGLASNYTLGVLPGIDSTLWVSTTNGLSLFDLKNGTFKNFDERDGLQDNQFNYGAQARDEQGELIFGGINGFNIIIPERVRRNEYIPPVLITNLKIFNEDAGVGPGEMLAREIAATQEVRLAHDQNMLSFSFVALNYVMAGKNRYRYRLEGLEERWVDAAHATMATYANLAPGDYTFRVQGSNNDGAWNERGASLRVVIVPPYWQRAWFIALIALAGLLIVGTLAWLYVFRQTLKNKLLLEKTQARKLHELDREKLQFFINVSHEIRTPLTLIIGPVEKLWRQARQEEARLQLDIVYRNARKLLELVNQLLDFRKLDAGQYRAEYQNGDLVRFLSGVTESFRHLAGEKGLTLAFTSNCEKLVTALDTDKMEKIMNNLLSNAFKFTRRGGVTVTLTIDEAAYEVRVEDTGAGIPPENLPRIFNRFFHASRAGEVAGTGIGLSITKSFVELLEGSVEVKSEEGKGTTFTLSLPLREERAARDDDATPPGAKYLLVVDDNEDIRAFIRDHFKAHFRVLEAANGKEGHEIALERVPDIIIVDMLMPVMDGHEMCKRLKKDERTSHIPLIMLTAITSKEKELDALLTGIDDYVTKPFDVNILGAKVDNLLQVRDTLRERIRRDWLMQPGEVTLESPDDKFLRKAVSVVEKFMDDPGLDIEKFALEMGVSRMQLYRKFEALANMTVKEFIRDVRLRRAAQMLRQEKLTVSEIAWAVGFKDLPHFRRCFKEAFGMTPTEFCRDNE
ncbi:MAG: helix-turn-helix domain-containing protein, partial [Odoribacteraceae bacterium]|nr:helix-turn-helix domain-containing protein [Odoribacteraceae bacterium]